MNEQKKGLLQAVRRSVGLALAGIALWGVWITADFTAAERELGRIEDGRTAVALLAEQTRVPARTEGVPEGPGKLLLRGSPLLAQSWQAVWQLGQTQGKTEEPEDPPEDRDDIQPPELQPPVREDGVLEMTGKGKDGAQYLSRDGLYLYNRTKLELTPAVLSEGSVKFTLGEGPQILIYHTHGSEAYIQSDGETYTESDAYRTTDCTHNVVRVGEEIAQVLRAYGFQVIHDTELYDYPASGRRCSGGWSSIPRSNWPWTCIGMHWWERTAPFTSLSPPRTGSGRLRSCWWWVRGTTGGRTIWPWQSGFSGSWWRTMSPWPARRCCAAGSIIRTGCPAPCWWRWADTETPSPRPWPGRGCLPKVRPRCMRGCGDESREERIKCAPPFLR